MIISENVSSLENPRKNALSNMRKTIPSALWDQNTEFLKLLRYQISNHRVSHHPAIETLKSGCLSLEQLKIVHLEYRNAIVQIFTDALLMAQFQTKQLEPILSAGSKMPARFLLSLNILDEFGFKPGVSKEGYYLGNPDYAHYPLYEKVLDSLEISEHDKNHYIPSKISDEVKSYLEDSYDCYISVTALLAVAEQEVILFSPALREAVKAVGRPVNSGYYFVHGVSDDEFADAADDDHEDDLWFILTQACTESNYEYLSKICMEYCELWCQFWDHQMENWR
ncbi:hypothetical protein QE380_001810 [Acinetobacter baylyi]|uniref:Iron-containing redox enzyme family protein n=1 Tax=Acinetobacter baylyi TaxID=202950 RepID=A0ABU0UWH3_ACIBI|nr:hypothetical protein [Acinetobacter baylyi]MDQ1208887.1 hypothetical protein [Acinetobacter baylyi]MDR6107519.1 hypothetical protein [Acinetobacter baylyi]MDR6185759.1 hypothetical protein [Acinetobacter baylyi]